MQDLTRQDTEELNAEQAEGAQGGAGSPITLGFGMPALDSQRIGSTPLVNNENIA
jgi:hypothetical protein